MFLKMVLVTAICLSVLSLWRITSNFNQKLYIVEIITLIAQFWLNICFTELIQTYHERHY